MAWASPPRYYRTYSSHFRRPSVEARALGSVSLSKRIVEALGGHISIHSELGQGCSVRVELARTNRDAITAKYLRPISIEEHEMSESRLQLLVIDDEVAIATTLKDILLDYHVTIAVSAREALTLFMSGRYFDAVLCDLMMPEITGPELYREACRDRPELTTRFIFMTGGAFTDYAREFLERTSCPTLSKPFTVANVCRVVEQAVEQSRMASAAAL